MAKREARRKNGIEAVAIVTPNHMHAPAAREFLKRGIHVICDKPLTATLAEAKKLAKAAAESDALFVLTHNYTGYPMVRQARAMVRRRLLGPIRVVQVEYAQDWLATPVEETGAKQAEWRTDPAQSGAGGSTGDIGTHAFNLASFVTGLKLEALAADLQRFVPGRKLDDNGHVLLRFEGGARGMLWCSQVATGNENALRLRVYGDKGGLEWAQEDPNYLWYTPLGEPKRLITRGGAGAGPDGGAGQPDAGRASGGLSRGLCHHLRRGGAGDPGEAGRAAGARRRGLSDDRGRRDRRRLRRGLRALLVAQRRLGHPLNHAAPRARGWRAATKRSGTRVEAEPAARPALSGRSAISCSASAMPTASRSAWKCDSGGIERRGCRPRGKCR